MVELETWIIPILGNIVSNWKRFVDVTVGYVKNGSIDIILSKHNSFHPNIQKKTTREEEEQTAIFRRLTNQKWKFC